MNKIAMIAVFMLVVLPFTGSYSRLCAQKSVKGATISTSRSGKVINFGSIQVTCRPNSSGFSANA